MAWLRDVVFDSHRPAPLARFWAAVLDGYTVAPYDEAELARLQAMGIDDVEDDPSVLVEPQGGGPRLFFQAVPEDKVGKNRMHLDLVAEDLEAEIDRIVQLGARILARHPGERGENVVLADPEGNELCVTAVGD